MTRWRIATVAGLPHPHLKCRWKEQHRAAVESASDDVDGRRRAFERFVSDLGPERIAQCRYHQTDWHRAASLACKLAAADVSDMGEAGDAAIGAGFDARAIEGAASFFAEPMFIDGDRLGSGQRRSCAMRLASVLHWPLRP